MIQTQNIHSLTDFQRNTASHIKRMQDSGLPEVLTVKGRAELVVQSAESYQALLNRLELHESAAGIARGLQDLAEGRVMSLDDFEKQMRAKLSKVGKGR